MRKSTQKDPNDSVFYDVLQEIRIRKFCLMIIILLLTPWFQDDDIPSQCDPLANRQEAEHQGSHDHTLGKWCGFRISFAL